MKKMAKKLYQFLFYPTLYETPLIIERMEVDLVFSRLFDKHDLRVLDIGAHHGEFCDIMERHNDNHFIEMVCVEPLPENIGVIKSKINKYKRTKVTLCECAVSDQSDTKTFFMGSASTLFTTTPEWKDIFKNDFHSTEETPIACYTIKDLFEKFCIAATPQIDFVKIDTEGHDLHVLKSLIDAGINPLSIMFEVDPRLQVTTEGIELLRKNGFQEFYIFGRTGIPTTYIGEYQGKQQMEQLREKGRLEAGNVIAFH